MTRIIKPEKININQFDYLLMELCEIVNEKWLSIKGNNNREKFYRLKEATKELANLVEPYYIFNSMLYGYDIVVENDVLVLTIEIIKDNDDVFYVGDVTALLNGKPYDI